MQTLRAMVAAGYYQTTLSCVVLMHGDEGRAVWIPKCVGLCPAQTLPQTVRRPLGQAVGAAELAVVAWLLLEDSVGRL